MRVPIKLGYFRLPMPELRVLIIPCGGWLGEIDDERAILLIDALKQLLSNGAVDAVQFHYLDISLPLMREALGRPTFFCKDHVVTTYTRRLLDLPPERSGLFASLSSNQRYQARKRGRSLAQNFSDIRIQKYCSPEDVASLMQNVECVAQKSYQRGIGVGFSMSDEVRCRLQFYADAGWLRGFVLFLDDTPRAFWIGTLRDGVFTSEYLAFDPDFGKYAPGMYLILEVAERLATDGDVPAHQIDFGGGDSDYKKRLSNRDVCEAIVFIFAPNLIALSVNLLRSALGHINPMLRYLTARNVWLAKAKQLWRFRVLRETLKIRRRP